MPPDRLLSHTRNLALLLATAMFASGGCATRMNGGYPPRGQTDGATASNLVEIDHLRAMHARLTLDAANPFLIPDSTSVSTSPTVSVAYSALFTGQPPEYYLDEGNRLDWNTVLGRFDVVVSCAPDAAGVFEVDVVGLTFDDLGQAEGLTADLYFGDTRAKFRETMVARLRIDAASSSAAVLAVEEIWSRWEAARILALLVVGRAVPASIEARPPPIEPLDPTTSARSTARRWCRFITIERACWPGTSIELVARDNGLVLATPRANVPRKAKPSGAR